MGDRTTVVVKIRRSDFNAHEKFFRSNEVGASYVDLETEEHTVSLTGDEINYAEWKEIETFLKDNEMEYDKWWGAGGDYESGNAYYRKIRGKYKGYEIYNTQEAVLETVTDLTEKFLKNPNDCLKEMKRLLKQLHPFDAKSLNEQNSARFIKE